MSYEHDYYSDQCAGCKWAEWRGGCLNKATADDGSDLDAAERDECKHFEAGNPQKRQLQPGDRLSVVLPLDDFDALHTRAEAAEQRAEALAAELAQARADARVLLATMASSELDRKAHDLFEQAVAAEEYGTPRGRELASRLREAAEAAEAEAVAVIRRALGGT